LLTLERPSTEWWQVTQAGMWSFSIVEVQPARQLLCSQPAVGIDPPVGPFTKQSLDEALCLAVGLRPARSGAYMTKSECQARLAEVMCTVTSSVVGKNPANADALVGKPGARAAEKGSASRTPFIRQDLCEGDARVVVDRDMHEFVSSPTRLMRARAGDAMPRSPEARQALDIKMQQIACLPSLVARDRLWRIKRSLRPQSVPREDGTDGRTREAQLATDKSGRLPKMAQVQDDLRPLRRQGVPDVVRPRRPVAEARQSVLSLSLHPLIGCMPADTGRRCCAAHAPTFLADATNQQSSTDRRSTGILMNVHPGFSSAVDRLAPISFSGLARVNNPHRNHN
jgi:hypothetical protein